ncbi:MAG: tetratricopeptide repeat protein [Spirochaetales bacterium]|nr:tetratricopeptide repeat protein [Spirochaetales bacterium]
MSTYKGPQDAPRVLAEVEKRMAAEKRPLDTLSRSDLIQYGGLQLADHRIKPAETTFTALLTRDPKDREALYSLSLIALAQGQNTQSQTYLDRLLTDYPKDWQALSLKGQIALADGKKPLARQAIEASLNVHENSDALLGMAQLAESAKKWKDAENYLDRAIRLDPSNDEAFSSLSRVDQAQEKWYSAEKDISQAITLSPADPWHYLDRARLCWVHLYKPDQALADANKVLQLDPQNFFGHLYRAQILDSKNKTSEAWSEYQWVIKSKPQDRAAYPPATMLAFQYKDWTQAAALARVAAQDYPGEYAFPLIEALSAQFQHKPALAQQILQAASLRYAPGTAENEIFRFVMSPVDAFTMNDLLSKEKDKSVRVRLRFYEGCEYVAAGDPSSAKAAFQSIVGEQMIGIPEIRMAQSWLKDLGS